MNAITTAARVIPCLDVADGRVFKGAHSVNISRTLGAGCNRQRAITTQVPMS